MQSTCEAPSCLSDAMESVHVDNCDGSALHEQGGSMGQPGPYLPTERS